MLARNDGFDPRGKKEKLKEEGEEKTHHAAKGTSSTFLFPLSFFLSHPPGPENHKKSKGESRREKRKIEIIPICGMDIGGGREERENRGIEGKETTRW